MNSKENQRMQEIDLITPTNCYSNVMLTIGTKKKYSLTTRPYSKLSTLFFHRPVSIPLQHIRIFVIFMIYDIPKCMAWTSCQIREIASAHAPGMPGTFSPSPQVSDPDMHHGTCVTHVPWCMPGSLTTGFIWNRRRGKTFPAFPAHAQPAILRIW